MNGAHIPSAAADARVNGFGCAPTMEPSDARVVVRDADFVLYQGDVRDVLKALGSDTVDCALTSPPFYALRDYGVDGQIGLEATPDEWAAELVGVFREVRRLLKPEGTLWVECGDSYATHPAGNTGERRLADGGAFRANIARSTVGVSGLKPKDLIGSPCVARRLGRRSVGVELNGEYAEMCARRLGQQSLLTEAS